MLMPGPRSRSRVFICIYVPDNSLNESILSHELLPSLSVKDLKEFIKAKTSIPETSQRLFLDNCPILGDSRTLVEAGIRNGYLLVLREVKSHLDQDRNQGRFEGVEENLRFAYEHHPEAFGRVAMLYIPVLVNERPLKAFVGTGAQTTLISPSCAKLCDIWKLMDRRYAGVARGIGTSQILGRVHCVVVEIGKGGKYLSPFTIMEGDDFDLILGLDTLKRLQTKIDLRHNKLLFADGNEVDFLSEADSPTPGQQSRESNSESMQTTTPTLLSSSVQRGQIPPRPVLNAPAASPSNPPPSTQTPAVRNEPSTPASPSRDTQPSRTQPQVPPTSTSGTQSNPTTSLPARPTSPPPPYSLHPPSSVRPIRPQPRTPAFSNTNAQSTYPPYPDSVIDQLTSFGFSRNQAIAALDECEGNVEFAAMLLWSD